MRGERWQWPWLGAVLLGLAGCMTTQPDPKPPPRPDEFVAPPDGDKRCDDPRAAYPPETLNRTDTTLHGLTSPPGQKGGRGGGPGGMGGPSFGPGGAGGPGGY
jgi:hypothetical protein